MIVLHAEILSDDLQAGAEDEQDYEAPGEGNLLYKLYSLQDLLVMVRSSVSLTHTRKVGSSQNQVYMLVCTHPPEFHFTYLSIKLVNATALFLSFVFCPNSMCQCMSCPSWSIS